MGLIKGIKKELILLVLFLGIIAESRLLKPILIGDFFDNQQFFIFSLILFTSTIMYEKNVGKIENIKLFLLNEFYHLILLSIIFIVFVFFAKIIGDYHFSITPMHLFGILFYSALNIKMIKIFRYILRLGFIKKS